MTFVERDQDGLHIRCAQPVSIDSLAAAAHGDSWHVLSTGGGRIGWWDIEDGPGQDVRSALRPARGDVAAVAVARMPDGAEVGVGRTVLHGMWRWDLATGLAVGPAIQDPSLTDVFTPRTVPPPMVVVDLDDGPVVVTGSSDGSMHRWDILRGVRVGDPWTAHGGSVWSLAATVDPHGRPVLLSGGADGSVRCWDPRNGTAYPWSIDKCGRAVAIVPGVLMDGRTVVCVASATGNIHRRDLMTGEAIGLRISTGWVQPSRLTPVCPARLAFVPMPSGEALAVCVDDGRIQLWDVASGQPAADTIPDAGRFITALVAARRSDGAPLVVVGDRDGNVRRFDPRTGRMVGEALQPHGTSADRAAAVTIADGRIILAVHGQHRVRCFDAHTGDPVGDPQRPLFTDDLGVAAADLPDGRSVLISSGEQQVTRLDLTTGEAMPPVCDDEAPTFWDVTTSRLPEGRVLIIGAGHGVHRWDAVTGLSLGAPLQGHRDNVMSVAAVVQQDGTVVIISGDESGYLRRWDAATGAFLGEFATESRQPLNTLYVLPISGGGQLLVGVDRRGRIHQWNPLTGESVVSTIHPPEDSCAVVAHVDQDGIPSIFMKVPDVDGAEEHVQRWLLDTGKLLNDSLPRTLRSVYDDNGTTMMVLAEPDGTVTITQLPTLDR